MINSILPIILGLLGLLSAYIVYLNVQKNSEGSGKVKDIGDQIHLGAMVFMASEYKRLASCFLRNMYTCTLFFARY